MNTKESLEVIGIKTSDGKYYLSTKKEYNSSYGSNTMSKYLIDGEKPAETFDEKWVCVNSQPKKITKIVSQPNINYRYELQDKTLASKKLPEFIKREDVATYDDSEYEWIWSEDMKQYRSLYKEISDKQPDLEEETEFSFELILSTEKVVDPIKMKYSVAKTWYKSDGYKDITEKDVSYQIADRVIFPSIVLPQRPCKLTSEQTYKIVMEYIKDNINPQVAKITSDYDFCFTVKKRIRLAEIKKYTVDVNNNVFQKRKRKPKYVEKQQVEREVECFEMTHKNSNYQGYTPIDGFEAKNQGELKEKIDNYCEGVIEFINTPLEECRKCKGYGVIVEK